MEQGRTEETEKPLQTSSRLPYLRINDSRLNVLQSLTELGVAQVPLLTRFRLRKTPVTESELFHTRLILRQLQDAKYVRSIRYHPGPVWGISERRLHEVKDLGLDDIVVLKRERRTSTLEHDLKRSRTHELLDRYCYENQINLSWKKTDLYRTVEPDDLIRMTHGKETKVFFFELENHKKKFADLCEKVKRYFDYWGTDKCLKEWGTFQTFNVIFQFASHERMMNFLRFLRGDCRCIYYRGKLKHTCLVQGHHAEPLRSGKFWFTTDELVEQNVGGAIFYWADNIEEPTRRLFDLDCTAIAATIVRSPSLAHQE